MLLVSFLSLHCAIANASKNVCGNRYVCGRRDLLDISPVLSEAGSAIIDVLY